MKFDKFRPLALKTRIARLSQAEGFPKSGHNYVYSNNVCYISTSCISLVIYNILCTVGKSQYTCDP